MIISKTPMRISYFGGGSDLPAYYRHQTGAVVATAIDKFVYINLTKKFDDRIRVSYSITETVDDLTEIKHDLVRTALMQLDNARGLEIVSISNLPGNGTGMGSSSAFCVGLLNCLKNGGDPESLAAEACRIEIDLLKKPIGKQDQYQAAYGGLNYIR